MYYIIFIYNHNQNTLILKRWIFGFFKKVIRMALTFAKLRRNSHCHIVDALIETHRIFESESCNGTRGLSLSLPDGRNVVLCRFGNLCNRYDCRMHHLHSNIDHIYEDFVRCPNDGACLDERCPYRHLILCGETFKVQRLWSRDFREDYRNLVGLLVFLLEAPFYDEIDAEADLLDPDNEIPDEMIRDEIHNARQSGNREHLIWLEQQGYNTEI